MKKIICILLAAFIALMVLSGCQKTPENPLVVEKNMENMLEKADANEENIKLEEQVGTVRRVTKTIDAPTGNASCDINADVVIPNSDSITIMKVGRSSFTQDMTDKIIDTLMHGQMYEATEQCINSKGGYASLILSEKNMIAEMKQIMNSTEDEEIKAQYAENIENITKAINDLEKEQAEAPDEPIPTDGTLIVPEEENTAVSSQLFAMTLADDCYETLTVRNWQDNTNNYVIYVREANGNRPVGQEIGTYYTAEEIQAGGTDVDDVDDFMSVPDVSISAAEAAAKADLLLNALDIDQVGLIQAEKVYGGGDADNDLRCLYRLSYSRAVNDINETWTLNSGASFDTDDNGDMKTTVPPWAYERIMIYVDANGIAGFYWMSPYSILGTEVENAKVLPLDEALKVFEKMIFVKHAGLTSSDENEMNITFHITRIELGLARINYKDDYNSALLVPAWDFFGYITTNGEISEEEKLLANKNSFLTINAVDGSIIDRHLGY